MTPLGVILAGGQARRMGGGDKCLLPLGGLTLLERIIRSLEAQVDGIVLNANGDPSRFAPFGLQVISDDLPEHPGPLAGVLAGLEHAAASHSHIVTVAGDTPFVPADLVARLEAARSAEDRPIALAATREDGRVVRHPTVALWPVALRHDLRAALSAGTRKIVAWTDAHGAATAVFPGDPFFNINTPEDLETAEALLCA